MTNTPAKPDRRPARPYFSSGPCAKFPGWSLDSLSDAQVGRAHRSKPGKAKLNEVITRTRSVLGIPDDHRIGIVPASDTGAVEMALWSLLGPRGVDMLMWESFGKAWVTDVTKQLQLADVQVFEAPYGHLPDLTQADPARDVVFTWNGTTSGVRVPDASWIADDREGLTICDATSAAFAMELPWEKLDVTTWSWQKAMGGEGAHGMLVLSPRAIERLENYTPAWPLPKIFRLTKAGKVTEGLFSGATINTPSLLCVEDALAALRWMEAEGGSAAMVARSQANLEVVMQWVEKTDWIDFLAHDPASRSSTSICLSISDRCPLAGEEKNTLPKRIADLLDAEGIAFDINNHRDAPPSLRIWGGSTVDAADMADLMPWIDWAYATLVAEK